MTSTLKISDGAFATQQSNEKFGVRDSKWSLILCPSSVLTGLKPTTGLKSENENSI